MIVPKDNRARRHGQVLADGERLPVDDRGHAAILAQVLDELA